MGVRCFSEWARLSHYPSNIRKMRCKLRGEWGGALPPRVCPPLSRSAHRVSRTSRLLYVNLVCQVFVPYCARSVDLPDRGLGATKTLGTREFTRLSARFSFKVQLGYLQPRPQGLLVQKTRSHRGEVKATKSKQKNWHETMKQQARTS